VSAPARSVPSCVVRHPWPDELPRIADAFPLLDWRKPMQLQVLVAPCERERIVGVAALLSSKDKEPAAILMLSVRARFSATDAVGELLAAALAAARASGESRVAFGRPLQEGDPLIPVLARACFVGAASEQGSRFSLQLAVP
jgi:hypothetical protein